MGSFSFHLFNHPAEKEGPFHIILVFDWGRKEQGTVVFRGTLPSVSTQIYIFSGSCDFWERGYCSNVYVWFENKRSSYNEFDWAWQPWCTDHHIAFHVFCCHSFVTYHLLIVCWKVCNLLSIFCQNNRTRPEIAVWCRISNQNSRGQNDILLDASGDKTKGATSLGNCGIHLHTSQGMICLSFIHCLIVLFVSHHHLIFISWFCQQCCSLMGAYGVGSVALSPAFSWIPPLLLAAALYSTSKPW